MSMTSDNHMCCPSYNGYIFNKTMLGLTRQDSLSTVTTLPWPARSLDLSPIDLSGIIRDGELGIPRPLETRRQQVYGETEMSDGMVRKWIRQSNDGSTIVHDEERNGRPSVVNNGLVEKVNEKICENRLFTTM
ncbi:HTH_48 domain-containing protein [Trichonephila clavipes]|nr:HTH_48 domain-containing protein [Trichonephila clavipes]